jgi:hypothetical protein
VKVKDKIMQFEALAEEAINFRDEESNATLEHESDKPCSIVVGNVATEEESAYQAGNRNSILSNSSIDSTRSDNNSEAGGVNIEYGSSVFYVVWD